MKLTGKECLGVIATLLVLFTAIFGLVCAISMFYTDVKSLPIESGTQRTLVTAAHLGEIDGYTQVYVDEDTDFAIGVKEVGYGDEYWLLYPDCPASRGQAV